MRFVIDRCDICKADYDVQYPKPVGWITWKIADLDDEDAQQHEMHFCSEKCLRQYLLPTQPQQPQEQPNCKARRFLLWDESADSTEGVQWGDGRVQLETHKWEGENVARALFGDWEEFKASFPGSGVQWIDQEVAE